LDPFRPTRELTMSVRLGRHLQTSPYEPLQQIAAGLDAEPINIGVRRCARMGREEPATSVTRRLTHSIAPAAHSEKPLFSIEGTPASRSPRTPRRVSCCRKSRQFPFTP